MTQMKFRKIYTKTRRISMVYCKTGKHELAYKTKKIMNNKTYTSIQMTESIQITKKVCELKKYTNVKKIRECKKACN